MPVSCPSCAHQNRDGARFCDQCGVRLQQAEPRTGSPERKIATVLFADLKGSMDLQAALDVDAWAEVADGLVAILTQAVRPYEGTVEFTGDGMMALFGVQSAQEDHAERACRAALDLAGLLQAHAAAVEREHGVRLQMRMGLNSGEVVSARIGDDVHVDSTALGRTVSIAQRMESLADPGTVYLSAATARLVSGAFAVREHAPREVKGISGSVPVFQLLGPSRASTPGEPETRDGKPFVGRTSELRDLESALDRALSGRGGLVAVRGPAGVGKSRLCGEFLDGCARRGLRTVVASAQSHEATLPLSGATRLVRAVVGSAEDEPPATTRNAVAMAVGPGAARDAVLDVLGVAEAGSASAATPELRLHLVREAAVSAMVEAGVQVALVEDLHWFDAQSVSFVASLVTMLADAGRLLVTTERPDFTPPWGDEVACTFIETRPLEAEPAGALVEHLLGTDESTRELAADVLDRTAGNPFFIEELIHELVDDGTLGGSPGRRRLLRRPDTRTLPSTVTSVVSARIDRLEAGAKATLHAASVLGRTFAMPVLEAVCGGDAGGLEVLVGGGFLSLHGHEVTFQHPLIQEVTYATLVRSRRRPLHDAAARAIVAHQPELADARASLVAWHFECAGQALEAAAWNGRAGTFLRRNDLVGAIDRWRRVAELLEGVEETPSTVELAITASLRVVQNGGRVGLPRDEIRAMAHVARNRAERHGRLDLAAAILASQGTTSLFAGELAEAEQLYREAVSCARQTRDEDALAAAEGALPALALNVGPITTGLAVSDRILALLDSRPEAATGLIGYSWAALQLFLRTRLLAYAGRLDEAAATSTRAIRLSELSGDVELIASATSTLSLIAFLSGRSVDVGRAEATYRLASEAVHPAAEAIAARGVAVARLVAGDAEGSAAAAEASVDVTLSSSTALHELPVTLAFLSMARTALGSAPPALDAAAQSLAMARERGAQADEVVSRLSAARAEGLSGATDSAIAHLEAGEAAAREAGASGWLAMLTLERAQLAGDERLRAEARHMFEANGAHGHARRLR